MLQFHRFLKRAPHSCLAGSAYRECMDNGTWALKSNYSNCEPILEEKVSVASQEQCCYVLRSASTLLTILGENQSDLAQEIWHLDCFSIYGEW